MFLPFFLDLQNLFQVGSDGLSKEEIFAFEPEIEKIINALQKERDQGKIGFLNLCSLKYQEKTVKEISEFARKIRNNFENVIILGIGGSALGGKAIHQALKHPFWNLLSKEKRRGYPRIFFLDTIDPNYLAQFRVVLSNFKKTALIVICKSGETIETISLFSFFAQKIKKQNIVAVTGKKGPLFKFCQQEKIKVFEIPGNVPGRFSVLTPVGLLPAALMGIEIRKIFEGAQFIDFLWQKLNLEENLPAQLAVIQYLLDTQKKKNLTVLFSYCEKLKGFQDWWEQLFAESLGKSEKVGPTPLKAMGPRDQHSLLQLFQEGPNNKQFIFLSVELERSKLLHLLLENLDNPKFASFAQKDLIDLLHAEEKATIEALTRKKRPNLILRIPKINEKTLGQLFYLFELQIAIAAKLYGVNAYNQPGVELGKKLTQQFLK